MDDRHRLDKWLWCARFYKSRALATEAVIGGKVKLNGERVKPAHAVKVGDRLDVTRAEVITTLIVRALPARRGAGCRCAVRLSRNTGKRCAPRAAA